jgi:hypothetical protein
VIALIAVPERMIPPRGTVKSPGEFVRFGWPPNSAVAVAGLTAVCAYAETVAHAINAQNKNNVQALIVCR